MKLYRWWCGWVGVMDRVGLVQGGFRQMALVVYLCSASGGTLPRKTKSLNARRASTMLGMQLSNLGLLGARQGAHLVNRSPRQRFPSVSLAFVCIPYTCHGPM